MWKSLCCNIQSCFELLSDCSHKLLQYICNHWIFYPPILFLLALNLFLKSPHRLATMQTPGCSFHSQESSPFPASVSPCAASLADLSPRSLLTSASGPAPEPVILIREPEAVLMTLAWTGVGQRDILMALPWFFSWIQSREVLNTTWT